MRVRLHGWKFMQRIIWATAAQCLRNCAIWPSGSRFLKPTSFSEHLAWSTHDTGFLNDLLPVPYDQATLNKVVEHVDQVQEVVGRQML